MLANLGAEVYSESGAGMKRRMFVVAALTTALLGLAAASASAATGGVRGRVTDGAGNPVAGLCVMALLVDGGGGAGNVTQADGTYQLNFGVDATVHVVFYDCQRYGWSGEWWDNAPYEDTATAVHVSGTSFLDGIDAVVERGTHSPFASIVNVQDARQREGTLRSKTADVTVSLSSASAKVVSVSVRTEDGTAQSSSDYTAVDTTVVFQPGETTAVVHVPLTRDSQREPDETFSLVAYAISDSARAGHTSGTVTIVNDDLVTIPHLP